MSKEKEKKMEKKEEKKLFCMQIFNEKCLW